MIGQQRREPGAVAVPGGLPFTQPMYTERPLMIVQGFLHNSCHARHLTFAGSSPACSQKSGEILPLQRVN